MVVLRHVGFEHRYRSPSSAYQDRMQAKKKQKLRRLKPEMLSKVKYEVTKQLNAGFLKVAKHSEWVENIVPVPKKDGKVRLYVDYRDLNRAGPKDNFLLPHSKDVYWGNTVFFNIWNEDSPANKN